MNLTEWLVLRAVFEDPGALAQHLRKASGVQGMTMSAVLWRLEKAGHVHHEGEDRRYRRWYPTHLGRVTASTTHHSLTEVE